MDMQAKLRIAGLFTPTIVYRGVFTPILSIRLSAENGYSRQTEGDGECVNLYGGVAPPPPGPPKPDPRPIPPPPPPKPAKSSSAAMDSLEHMHKEGKSLTMGKTRRFVLVRKPMLGNPKSALSAWIQI